MRRLLDGELIDSTDLAYELEDWHIGAVGGGGGAADALQELAGSLDRRALLIPRDDGTIWGWLGAHKEVDPGRAYELIADGWPEEMRLGEPAKGREGWRLSHRQAKMKRLQRVESALKKDIRACSAELEAALRLEELGHLEPSGQSADGDLAGAGGHEVVHQLGPDRRSAR